MESSPIDIRNNPANGLLITGSALIIKLIQFKTTYNLTLLQFLSNN